MLFRAQTLPTVGVNTNLCCSGLRLYPLWQRDGLYISNQENHLMATVDARLQEIRDQPGSVVAMAESDLFSNCKAHLRLSCMAV